VARLTSTDSVPAAYIRWHHTQALGCAYLDPAVGWDIRECGISEQNLDHVNLRSTDPQIHRTTGLPGGDGWHLLAVLGVEIVHTQGIVDVELCGQPRHKLQAKAAKKQNSLVCTVSEPSA
jgi:hypothetical protein